MLRTSFVPAVVLSSAFALGALAACSSSTTTTTPETDAATAVDAGGGDADTDSGDTGAAEVVNDCKTFTDRSAPSASRTLTWDFSISSAPERCMIVAVGQSVDFNGDFSVHPLTASGGDSPNPIANADAKGNVTFTAAGTFGFACGVHPSMIGAIKVQ
jgi:plastocyanin